MACFEPPNSWPGQEDNIQEQPLRQPSECVKSLESPNSHQYKYQTLGLIAYLTVSPPDESFC